MNSNSFSGGLVVSLDVDNKEIEDYKNMLDSLSLEDFIKVCSEYSIDKSYESAKVSLRKSRINKYYRAWVNSIYIDLITDSINNDKNITTDMSNVLIEKIKNITAKIRDNKYTYARLESITYMVNEIQPTRKTEYTCTVFSIRKTGSERSTNYAYLYSIITPIFNRTNISIEHKYFCTGTNLLSSDGEYRNRFTTILTLENSKLNNVDIWHTVEEYLINRPKVKFSQSYYIPDKSNNIINKTIKNDINARRYAIDMYIIVWINRSVERYLNLNNNTDQTYKKNIFDIGDERFMLNLIETYGIEKLKLFYWESSYITNTSITRYAKHIIRYNPIMGQKIIPLSLEEVKNIKNIRYSAWREYHILEKVTDLVVNLICPGVPITHEWFYVHGVDKHMFNNPDLFNRKLDIDNTDVYTLKNSRMYVYNSPDMENTVVSDQGILIISEHVGRTIPDMVLDKCGITLFSDIGEFTKYLFDISYALLCMNSILNVIHGDLHISNTTIQQTNKAHIVESKPNNINSHIVYVVGKDVFIFKDYGIIGTVIDFSRGFIIPTGEEYLDLKQSQSDRIIDYYNKLFPKFMKSFGDKLILKLDKNFKHVYKVFSAIDLYIHTDKLLKFIEKNNLQTHRSVKELIMKVYNMSKNYLEVVMEKIVTANKDVDIIYPNHDIILNCFSDNIISSKKISNKNIEIDDIYFYNNKLRYSISCYDKLPPRIKYNRLKKREEPKVIDIPQTNNSLVKIALLSYYNFKS